MSVQFCAFRFLKEVTPATFYRYKIISLNPNSRKSDFKGNSIRYQIRQNKENRTADWEKIFIYVMNNEYLITNKEIKNIPEIKNIKIEPVSQEKEEFPLNEQNIKLYAEFMKYGIYHIIFQYCRKNRNAIDYTKEDSGLYTMPYSQSPKNNIGVILKKKFKIDVEIMPDGVAYLFVNMNCNFESTKTIWDLICQGENVIDMNVECDWQSYQRTYQLKKIYDTPVSQPVNDFCLTDYWNNTAPWHLNGINPKQYAVSVYDSKEDRNGLYIPQSLRPVVTRAYISQRDRQLSNKIDKYTKLSMSRRLQAIQEFLAVLNDKKGIIDTVPVPIETFGYYYFDCTKNIPNLLIANGRKITLKEKSKAFKYGFYKNTDKPVVTAFMSYQPERQKSQNIVQSISDFCNKGMINKQNDSRVCTSLIPLSFYSSSFLYKKGDSLSYETTAKGIKKNPEIKFVISVLPIDNDEDSYYEETVSPYSSFKKVFASLELPSQMVSLEMINTLSTNNAVFYLQNLALGILSKSGGIPWILEKPMDNVDCFVGLDVGTKQKGIHYPACSVCLSARGNLIKYYTTPAVQQGEKINTSILEDIFNKILIAYSDRNGHYPEHIVIHRDGFSNEDMAWYIHYFESKNIRFDLVEIKKFVSRRLLDDTRREFEYNPAIGTAVIKENEAYIITTDIRSYLGSPQPIHIVHKHGDLSMKSIAKQIYVLSEMHTGSMRTSRLPLTTFYADKICKNHDYVPLNKLLSELYFL